ncbi:hypothetical protein ELQ90_00690 [Labedella phragmitis]|uniref:Uncharacterized protein n=1 Tax=Labedella phragmitis TaxID=2498849 RepID=A0A3S3Z5W3_9MICO|nr:hypothetical protein [Labedella phragmitis]RWZ52510.1 hypothetical protein ELQ90_00690 [Labedella phragmitis]
MGSREWKPVVWRVLRLTARAVGRSITVVLAVLAALGGKSVGPMISSHERPPVPREECRP